MSKFGEPTGGGGGDLLNGGAQGDRMEGGGSGDTYIVNSGGDVVVEKSNQGQDLVKSSVSFTLPNNVEDLNLIGTKPANGTGNNAANSIFVEGYLTTPGQKAEDAKRMIVEAGFEIEGETV